MIKIGPLLKRILSKISAFIILQSMNWSVSGHPQPTLSWSHSDLSPRDLYSRVKVTESQAVLALGPVTRDMAGVYTCTGNKRPSVFFKKHLKFN